MWRSADLKTAGATEINVSYNKHIKVHFYHGGQRKMLVMPATPSDWRGRNNTRRDIRRVLREAAA